VTSTTAPEAPGGTNASSADPEVDRISVARAASTRSPRPKRPWTLPAPWTRRRAHRALENGGPFPTDRMNRLAPLSEVVACAPQLLRRALEAQ
jgi:hypothetical protein